MHAHAFGVLIVSLVAYDVILEKPIHYVLRMVVGLLVMCNMLFLLAS